MSIREKEDGLDISSYNGKISVVGQLTSVSVDDLNFELNDKGSVTVDAKCLGEALESFPVEEIVVFELKEKDGAKELYIKEKNDEDQYQTLTCFDEAVKMPETPKKFVKEVSVQRDCFISSLNKISFAFGYESERHVFLHWVLRVSPNKLRFVSGTGKVFAILDIEDTKAVNTKDTFNILFFNEFSPSINKILSSVSDNMIKIKESDVSDNYQILLSTSKFEIALTGMNPDIKWVDENSLLNKDYGIKVITKNSDWNYATKGIEATHTDEMKKEGIPHKVALDLDINKKTMLIKAENTLKSLRKINIIDCVYPKDKPQYSCMTYSTILSQVTSCGDKEGYMQMEFQGDVGKQPIIIYYNALDKISDGKSLNKTNGATGFAEKFAVIFIQTA